jgi:hypothetical protein
MDDEHTQRTLVNVRHNHVLQDGLAKLARASFVPTRPLSVKFADNVGQS